MALSELLLFALSASPPGPGLPPVRLPAVTMGTERHLASEVVAALYDFSPERLVVPGTTPPDPARVIVLVWNDGRVLWSADQLHGGPPYQTGTIPSWAALALSTGLRQLDDAAAAQLTRESLGPDARFTTLYLRPSGGRGALMRSWHRRPPDAPWVATSRGLVALEGRDPAAVLAADTADYQRFRRVWDQLESSLTSASRSAQGSAKQAPVTPVFEWTWVKEVAPWLELRLKRRVVPPTGHAWDLELVGTPSGVFHGEAELRDFLARQPVGTVVSFDPGCLREGDEPLLSTPGGLEAFGAFCAAHGIALTVLPGG